MGLIKYIKKVGIPRWSTLIPILFYLIFIYVVLNITFSNKATKAVDEKQQRVEKKEEKAPETVILASADNDGTNLLKAAFKKADLDANGSLELVELAKYINSRIKKHIDNAVQTNPFLFAKIDVAPQDGLISWEEYHAHFLREHGISEDYINEHNEKKHVKLDRKLRELIMRDRASWSEAARNDPFSLTLDEFLAFRHPESSTANLLSLVDDLLRQFDLDGDDKLTIEEFSSPDDEDFKDSNKKKQKAKSVIEKREEFKRLIDKNGDGKADRGELLTFIDPRHPRHALQESATLISIADKDQNGQLSIDEILLKPNLFLASKMITSDSFHDDF